MFTNLKPTEGLPPQIPEQRYEALRECRNLTNRVKSMPIIRCDAHVYHLAIHTSYMQFKQNYRTCVISPIVYFR